MTSETRDAFYTIAYDLPSEYLGFLQEDKADTEEVKKLKLATKSDISRLRFGFYNDLRTIGRYVNNSVFIIPKCKMAMAEKIIEDVRGKYTALQNDIKKKFGRSVVYDITTIQFDTSESIRLRGKAKQAMESELDKLCDELDERISELSSKKKAAQDRSVKKMRDNVDELVDVLKGFKLEEDADLKNLVSQIDVKIQDLANLRKPTPSPV